MSRYRRKALPRYTSGRNLTVVSRSSKGLARWCRARSSVKGQPGGGAAGYEKDTVRDETSLAARRSRYAWVV